jgi:hypothetical protein
MRCRSRLPGRYGCTLATQVGKAGDLGQALVRTGVAKDWR